MSSIRKETKISEALFDFLWCPVCGHTAFRHDVFQGVFCDSCNTEVVINYKRQSSEAEHTINLVFNTHSTKDLYDDSHYHPIPDGRCQLLVTRTPQGYHVDEWRSAEPRTWSPVPEGGIEESPGVTPNGTVA